MPISLIIAACALLAYVAGSINFTIVAVRLWTIEDPRRAGSRNPGVTNLYRTAGPRAAFAVLALELAKAFLAIVAARLAGLGDIAPAFAVPYVLGNLFPLFHGFRGGKGVAATVGVFLTVNPLVMLAGGGVFFLAFAASRRVSLGSLAMVLSYPLWVLLFGDTRIALAAAVALCGIVLFTHRENISRLIKGREPRLERTP